LNPKESQIFCSKISTGNIVIKKTFHWESHDLKLSTEECHKGEFDIFSNMEKSPIHAEVLIT